MNMVFILEHSLNNICLNNCILCIQNNKRWLFKNSLMEFLNDNILSPDYFKSHEKIYNKVPRIRISQHPKSIWVLAYTQSMLVAYTYRLKTNKSVVLYYTILLSINSVI